MIREHIRRVLFIVFFVGVSLAVIFGDRLSERQPESPIPPGNPFATETAAP